MESVKGTGLGLALVKAAADAHGGAVEVTSAPNAGEPVHFAPPPGGAAMTARILIADDEPSIVMAVRDELNFEGFEVHAASDGPGASRAAREIRPDVLLLDLMLPGINGFEVCRRSAAERSGSVDHHADGARPGGRSRHRFRVGADDYVTKPFSLRELIGRIRVGLRRAANRPL